MSGRMFYVGQPVVCVDGKVKPIVELYWPGLIWPIYGQRYTVRGYVEVRSGWPGLVVQEIRNRTIFYWSGTYAEASFDQKRFVAATDQQVRAIVEDAIKPRPRTDGDAPWYEPQRKKETAE